MKTVLINMCGISVNGESGAATNHILRCLFTNIAWLYLELDPSSANEHFDEWVQWIPVALSKEEKTSQANRTLSDLQPQGRIQRSVMGGGGGWALIEFFRMKTTKLYTHKTQKIEQILHN